MANHKSALKRIRSNETKKSLNKLQHKTTRNAIKKLKDAKTKKEATVKEISIWLLVLIELMNLKSY